MTWFVSWTHAIHRIRCYLGSDSEAGVQEGQPGEEGEGKDVGTLRTSSNPKARHLAAALVSPSEAHRHCENTGASPWQVLRQTFSAGSSRKSVRRQMLSFSPSTEEATEARQASTSRLSQAFPSNL